MHLNSLSSFLVQQLLAVLRCLSRCLAFGASSQERLVLAEDRGRAGFALVPTLFVLTNARPAAINAARAHAVVLTQALATAVAAFPANFLVLANRRAATLLAHRLDPVVWAQSFASALATRVPISVVLANTLAPALATTPLPAPVTAFAAHTTLNLPCSWWSCKS